MPLRRTICTYLGAAGMIVFVLTACDSTHLQGRAKPGQRADVHVYLLRGLINVFSLGLDSLAGEIERHGIPTTVANHMVWSGLAEAVAQQYKSGRAHSIIIIGHSLGGGAALDMAAQLGRDGVPVSLVVTLDPVGTSTVSGNIRRAVNFYVSGGIGARLSPSENSRTVVQNLDQIDNPDVGHISVTTTLNRLVLPYVLDAAGADAAKPR